MTAVEIRINGIVQGVGFRPFVHRIAKENGLKGWVRNTTSGAEIQVAGNADSISAFLCSLEHDAPVLATIESLITESLDEAEFEQNYQEERALWNDGKAESNISDFIILESKSCGDRRTLISPDVAICPDCLRELKDPSDRRYGYSFINCTNCGPRFTIIRDVPYDRKNTSMTSFKMCPSCQAEYDNIENRRYHAQPDCCSECGPKLSFYLNEICPCPYEDVNPVGISDKAIEAQNKRGVLDGSSDAAGCLKNEVLYWEKHSSDAEMLGKARALIKAGKILAIKGIGGIHLACLAEDKVAVNELRRRKQRDDKPFAIMCADTDIAKKFCDINDDEKKVLESSKRPIVLMDKKMPGAYEYLSENAYIGIMLPYTPLHYLLFEDGIESLVMTSANLSDMPIMYDNQEALNGLKDVADGFLLHNREIVNRCDDSLLWVIDGKEYFVRRSRGYVPYPLTLKGADGILACGAEQKASFAISKEGYVFPGAHIGDLKNFETYDNYQGQIERFERLFDADIKYVACDLHPDYMSSAYAKERSGKEGLKLIEIQHHHAHMASCMADNGLEEECIGIIWDGTGLGTDGTIWGSEFLLGDYQAADRYASFKPVALAGGDKAAKETWRTGIALLEEAGIDSRDFFKGAKADLVRNMLTADINCPKSSGMGRLFDAVSAVLGIAAEASYEGRGAVLLEAAAIDDGGSYDFDIIANADTAGPVYAGGPAITSKAEQSDGYQAKEIPAALKMCETRDRHMGESEDGHMCEAGEVGKAKYVIDTIKMVRQIVKDLYGGADKSIIAGRFINTLVRAAVRMCGIIREETGLNKVVLSGGSFQDMYILKRIKAQLKGEGFEVFTHNRVSCNDEGISFGQSAVASCLLKGIDAE